MGGEEGGGVGPHGRRGENRRILAWLIRVGVGVRRRRRITVVSVGLTEDMILLHRNLGSCTVFVLILAGVASVFMLIGREVLGEGWG